MSSCSFTSGGTTVAAFCEAGCCTDDCCSDSSTDGSLVAIIIAAVIGGLILLLLLALLLWCLLRKKNKGEDKKPIQPKKNNKDLESGKKKNMLVGYAPTQSYMTRKVPPPARNYDRNKMTQTINHRSQPGDTILKSKGLFVPANGEQKVYLDYLQSNKTFEVGTSTDGKDTASKKHSKWNSTANFYTRRDSLKGSSEEDESLPSFRAPASQDGVLVNMYGYAARDSSKTDYVIKDDKDLAKAQTVVTAFRSTRWQPHTKSEASLKPPTSAQRKWRDSALRVQEDNK